jgi:hypothetical protein
LSTKKKISAALERDEEEEEDLPRNAAIHHFCLQAFQRFEGNLVFS